MAIPTERIEATGVEPRDIITPVSPRVRWGGVMSGLFIAIGTLMLLTALGLAIGITAVGDPRAATGETASGLGIGAGIWAFITLLVAVFLGGMVSTQVTDSPDRAGAVIHAVLVWVLFLLVIMYLIVSGMSLGLTGLFGAVGAATKGATAAVGVGGDLTQRLGLDDPNRVLQQLDDPRTASTLATATGMSSQEAQAALSNLRARVEAAKDDPARVTGEVRAFLAQYAERAKQHALAAAASAQRGATIGFWITFGVMVVSLAVAIAGALSGVPSLQSWRHALVRRRAY
jgi:cytochrome c-type biogenesis protein CcmH/NrfG